MKQKRILNLIIAIALGVLTLTELPPVTVEGQGSIRFQQPFAGTARITSYVDHDRPNYVKDGEIVVYNGERRRNCPSSGEAWTDQGPYCYHGHDGTDYALTEGTNVLAAAPGIVSEVINSQSGFGSRVKIDHGNGYTTLYAHLQSGSQTVSEGTVVVAGQQIALSGDAGNGGYHLHFGVYYNGQPTDPFGWRGSGTDPLPSGPAICLWGDGQCSETVVEDRSEEYSETGGTLWDWYHTGNSWTLRYVPNRMSVYDASSSWRPDATSVDGPHSIFAFVPTVYNQFTKTSSASYKVYEWLFSPAETVNIDQEIHDEQ